MGASVNHQAPVSRPVLPNLDWHAGAVEGEREEHLLALETVVSGGELQLGEAEGVTEVEHAVHIRIREVAEELGRLGAWQSRAKERHRERDGDDDDDDDDDDDADDDDNAREKGETERVGEKREEGQPQSGGSGVTHNRTFFRAWRW